MYLAPVPHRREQGLFIEPISGAFGLYFPQGLKLKLSPADNFLKTFIKGEKLDKDNSKQATDFKTKNHSSLQTSNHSGESA
jgi:hypothetical protein